MMRTLFKREAAWALLGGSAMAVATAAQCGALSAGDYARAERFLAWNQEKYLLNGDVRHHWLATGDRFWYRRAQGGGATRFILVDAKTGERGDAFDHARLASTLSRALQRQVTADRLPFVGFRYAPDASVIQFIAYARLWTCQPERQSCTSQPAPQADAGVVLSPDAHWAAFLRGHDLWVRATDGSAEFALTSDGADHYRYAATPGNNVLADEIHREGRAPVVLWSPDSRRILTYRLDERDVGDLHVLQTAPRDGTVRPKLLSYRYSLPNEAHKARLTQMVFDVASRKRIDLAFAAMPVVFQSPIESRYVWWSKDGSRVYYIERGAWYRSLALKVADTRTGLARTLIEERGSTFIEPAGIARQPMVRVLASGQIIWFSERDGWGHLYLYDEGSGRLLNRITSGEWVVRGIVRVDERRRTLYFIGSGREAGRNPYLRYLYRVQLDGSDVQLLTPEDADHGVNSADDLFFTNGPDDQSGEAGDRLGFSPSGRYFIDSYSRPDLPPISTVRRADGRLIRRIQAADVSLLRKDGFSMPEPFQALADDGKTVLYGVLLRPSHFDAAKRYPIIDSIYPGPQVTRVQYTFPAAMFDSWGAGALAELGFIVVTVDGRGTPQRSKAFLDESYGKLASAGTLADHVAVLRQLAARHPWMDLERVGISGYSGGGFASARAILEYPQFFKVAVAASGNHDQRGYLAVWGETYNGPDDGRNYLQAANAPLASQLQGRLLLMHGGMDSNVHTALTMQLVEALIRANKDFDLLIVPDAGHNLRADAYPIRREWDYFVRHLMGAEPPREYRIVQGVQRE